MTTKALVPIDFSEVTENALLFAINAAKTVRTGIMLLHVVDKKSELKNAEIKLEQLAEKFASHGVPFKTTVLVGNIFDGIANTAKACDAGVVIMGTHGLKGMQYLFGSHALKVVATADVPFIITQNKRPNHADINNIVVPLDMAKEDKQVLTAVERAATVFKAKAHLFVAKQSDEFLNNAVQNNLVFAKKFLHTRNISYTVTEAKSEENFTTQTVAFAQEKNADLIAMVNHYEDGVKNLFGANYDQNLITNEAKIPVLIINSKDPASVRDIFMVFK